MSTNILHFFDRVVGKIGHVPVEEEEELGMMRAERWHMNAVDVKRRRGDRAHDREGRR